ncbi:polysaccharide lyase, partial [Pontibacter silvestris]
GLRQQFGPDHAFKQVSSITYTGSKSGRFELRDTDPMVSSGTRTEVLFPVQDNLNRWYAFSVYFPSSDWQYDTKQDVITQWHQGGGKNPSSSFRVIKDRLLFDNRKDPDNTKTFELGPLVKDKWQTFVVHIKHSHGSDGLLEIWQNGVKVVSYAGANSYDSSFDSPRWKVGIYKSDWNYSKTTDTKKRVLYYDEIRMGNENATLADMMPQTATVSLTPPAATSYP